MSFEFQVGYYYFLNEIPSLIDESAPLKGVGIFSLCLLLFYNGLHFSLTLVLYSIYYVCTNI